MRARVYLALLTLIAASGCSERPAAPQAMDRIVSADGAALYTAQCAACHGADGLGLRGQFPPLAGSDWVNEDRRRLVNVILHGLSGPILVNDEPWDGQMPGFSHLDDASVAAIAAYTQKTFGEAGLELIDAAFVAEVRAHGARYKATTTIAGQTGPRKKKYGAFPEGHVDLQALKAPAGFHIDVFARVNDARSLTRGEKGTIFVGNNRHGEEVYAVVDADGDMKADKIVAIAEGLVRPNAVAFKDGDLYVGEMIRVLRFTDIEERLGDPPAPEVVFDGFPNQSDHGKKYMKFGPDGYLYVPVGADCNVCAPKNEMDGTIVRMTKDGNDVSVIARGVRNSVGLDWNPADGRMWFTDNGRDLMGDDVPPCELNRLADVGEHFGFPACHGADIADPEFGSTEACRRSTPPQVEIAAHSSPLGMIFYRGGMFPPEYDGAIFVAEHGSWNRSKKVGYRVGVAFLKNGRVDRYEPFITGWLDEEKDDFWGRPVDLLELPDGSMLLSDDWANLIYRISYDERAAR